MSEPTLLDLSVALAQAVKARNQALTDLADAEMSAAWANEQVALYAEKVSQAANEIDRLSEAIKAADTTDQEDL